MHKVTVMKVSGSKKPSNSLFQSDPVANILSNLPMMNSMEEDGEEEYEPEDGEPYICVKICNLDDKVKDKLVSFLEKLKVKVDVKMHNSLSLGESKSDSTKEDEY